MGIAPVPAVEKLLARTGHNRFEIGLWELNEAFAAQMLAVMAELDPPFDRVNPWGGAIAIGHPLGMSGARLLGTLAFQMRRFQREIRRRRALRRRRPGPGDARRTGRLSYPCCHYLPLPSKGKPNLFWL